MKLLTLLFIAILFTACNTTSLSVDENISIDSVEKIAIPFREYGYSELPTKVISSQAGLDRLLQEVTRQPYWNAKPTFLEAMHREKIDFRKENLLLYRMTEGSGSVSLEVQTKRASASEVRIEIKRTIPQVGTSDMAYYMLAYKIDKGVKRVIFDDGQREVKIANKKADLAVPENCIAWFDGCNRCGRIDRGAVCTKMACLVYRPQDFRCTKWEE